MPKKLTVYTNEKDKLRYVNHVVKIDKSKPERTIPVAFFDSMEEYKIHVKAGNVPDDENGIIWAGAHKSLSIWIQNKIRTAEKDGKIPAADVKRITELILADESAAKLWFTTGAKRADVLDLAVATIYGDVNATIGPVDAVKIAIAV